jgi:mono/diheme cytochrome c family protein
MSRIALRPLPLALVLALVLAAGLTACGAEDGAGREDPGARVDLDEGDQGNERLVQGATIFAQRCAGCHTLEAAGAEGSASDPNNRERVDGPNLDQREVDYQSALYAIRNGGFSGAIMPQNIAVGREAQAVADFVSRYSGRDITPDAGEALEQREPAE